MTRILSRPLGLVERLFPKVPTLAAADLPPGEFQPNWLYYDLGCPSLHLARRAKAVVTFDRSAVSFWRKRTERHPAA